MSTLGTSLAIPALVGLIFTALALVVLTNWRLSFMALAGQYVCVTLLVAQVVDWPVLVARLVVGGGVILILFLTEREAAKGRANLGTAPRRWEFATGLPFRVAAAVMLMVVVWHLAWQPQGFLPPLPDTLRLGSYWLAALGLLNLGLTEEPMNAGMGLLMGLNGFEMVYVGVETSLAIVALLAAVDFGVALAVSYLALMRYTKEKTA